MRAGKMDRLIQIQNWQAGEPDDMGTVTEGWADLAVVRAQLIQSSTEEFMAAFGEADRTAVIFRIRWIDGLTTDHSVLYEGRRFNIRETKEIGRRKGLDVRCEEVKAA